MRDSFLAICVLSFHQSRIRDESRFLRDIKGSNLDPRVRFSLEARAFHLSRIRGERNSCKTRRSEKYPVVSEIFELVTRRSINGVHEVE